MPLDPAELQEVLARTAANHGPGLVGLVTEHGEPVFEGAVGVTDLHGGRAPTADDQFRIGSIWRGLGLVRYERPDGTVAFGHHGGVPGYTTVALRTTSGRAVVLGQNGIDLHDVLASQDAFVDAALAG